jgi:1-acyl-sn-glycerol-3-phosphate acyltransferase
MRRRLTPLSLAQTLHHRGWKKAWTLLAEGICRYFRVEVRGLEHIPVHGPVIVIANHSGFAGADAIVLSHLLHARLGRDTRILAHSFYFISRAIRQLSFGFGLREASLKTGLQSLRAGKLLLVFPEGERGNFKSSLKRYHLQPFHSGFVRMALATGAPVVPCLVTGAEETHWNLGSLGFGKLAPKLRIPLPVNWLPLPVKWRIRFLPARSLYVPNTRGPEARLKLRQLGAQIQSEMQELLTHELEARKHVFF